MIDHHSVQTIGVVVIGRNEGQRLVNCLHSLVKHTQRIIYVDSGSTDDSLMQAEKLGLHTVSLDLSVPFTAARARNSGFNYLLDLYPDMAYVQFIDGDCQIFEDWLPSACDYLNHHQDIAVVCGRRRERFPEKSLYNYLCDLEWNTPIGEAKACGGDALMRVSMLKLVGGYRDTLIAGEEPELCLRIRRHGGVIWRLDSDMTWHDAAMYSMNQWWKRSVRAGHAYAEGSYLYGLAHERHWLKETLRIIFWAILLPLTILIGMWIHVYVALLLFSIYLIQYLRLVKSNGATRYPWQYAGLSLLSKFAEATGLLKFYANLLLNKRGKLIEYK